MKLEASISGPYVTVNVSREGDRVVAKVDGREYELIAKALGANAYLLINGAAVSDCRVHGQPTSGEPLDVTVGAERYVVTLSDPKRLRGAHSGTAHADEAARITAPMPGKVVRVLVEVGSAVETGTGVIVVEAMKMQNEMKAPKAGTVVSLNVEVGATVNGGDVLAVIE